jgi:hypothetical protein
MITDAETFFDYPGMEGDVETYNDKYVWYQSWIGDAGSEEDGSDNYDVTGAALNEARTIAINLGFETDEAYAEHDFASFEFWRK